MLQSGFGQQWSELLCIFRARGREYVTSACLPTAASTDCLTKLGLSECANLAEAAARLDALERANFAAQLAVHLVTFVVILAASLVQSLDVFVRFPRISDYLVYSPPKIGVRAATLDDAGP